MTHKLKFSEFINKKISSVEIVEEITSHGDTIQRLLSGKILINSIETEFGSLEEAIEYIKNKQLEEEITKEVYDDLTENRIANIIREYHDVKVTDTLIESYLELASSKIFTVDPIVQKIRSLNKLDSIVEGKIHYTLSDGTTIAINERTQDTLNNLLANSKEIVEYMRESKNNFFYVLDKFKE